MRFAIALSVLLALAAPVAGASAGPADMLDRGAALLQALDKTTARVSRLPIAVGKTESFGGLRITLRACRKAPPLDPPESAAFLEIVEVKSGETSVTVFSGWMFASSPALSAVEHPVYDIWVLDCLE